MFKGKKKKNRWPNSCLKSYSCEMLKCFHFPSKSRLHNDPFLPSSLFETGLLSHSIIRGESGDATSSPLNICGKSLEAGRLHHRKYGNFLGNFGNLKEVYLLEYKNTEGIVENLTLFLALLQLIRNVLWFRLYLINNVQICTNISISSQIIFAPQTPPSDKSQAYHW